VHECFHSQFKTKPFVKPAWMKELLRHAEFSDRGFAVVLVPKFLLAPTRFVGMLTRGRSG
jgi:RAB protein geranylgeranyltransferase component A